MSVAAVQRWGFDAQNQVKLSRHSRLLCNLSILALAHRLPHQRDCRRQIALHQRSRNTQHPVTSPTKFDIAASVSRAALGVVGITIDPDDERDLANEEIDDVTFDDLLAPKRHPQTLAGGKQEM